LWTGTLTLATGNTATDSSTESARAALRTRRDSLRGSCARVLDFDVRDWTFYCEDDPLKSHEVARFKYTKHVGEVVKGGFDRSHFILSSDVLRIITVPDSLNGETGLICTLLESPFDFRELTIPEIMKKASFAKGRTMGAN